MPLSVVLRATLQVDVGLGWLVLLRLRRRIINRTAERRNRPPHRLDGVVAVRLPIVKVGSFCVGGLVIFAFQHFLTVPVENGVGGVAALCEELHAALDRILRPRLPHVPDIGRLTLLLLLRRWVLLRHL